MRTPAVSRQLIEQAVGAADLAAEILLRLADIAVAQGAQIFGDGVGHLQRVEHLRLRHQNVLAVSNVNGVLLPAAVEVRIDMALLVHGYLQPVGERRVAVPPGQQHAVAERCGLTHEKRSVGVAGVQQRQNVLARDGSVRSRG